MASPYNLVSRDAAEWFTGFSDEMRDALVLGEVDSWSEDIGLSRVTDALATRFPLPVSAAGYEEFKGQIKYRDLFERSLMMTAKPFADGVSALARVIEAPDFSDWAGEPARIAFEWQRLPNEQVAGMLALGAYDGPILDLYRDRETDAPATRRLFAADHPNNVIEQDAFGTFDNRISCTIAQIQSGEVFRRLSQHFRKMKGANGKPLGLRMSGGQFLAPGGLEEFFKDALEQDTLIRAVSNVGAPDADASVVAAVTQGNRHKGSYSFRVGDELRTNAYFYALAAGRPGLYPWAVQRQAAPEEVRLERDSDLYANTRKFGISYVGEVGVAGALPQGIVRVEVTDAPSD